MKLKKKLISGVELLYSMLIITLFSISLSNQAFSFESPFAPTKLKTALDTCRQVWGDVQALCQCKNACKQERALLIDAVLGRLVFLDHTVQDVLFRSKKTIASNDLAYLQDLIIELDASCVQLHEQDGSTRIVCMQRLINGIKAKFSIAAKK